MKQEDIQRRLTVTALLECLDDINVIANRLKSYGWDYEGDKIVITKFHVVNILKRFLSNVFSSEDVEKWANLVEGREDLEFEAVPGQDLGEIVYTLANPVLTQALDKKHAENIVLALENASVDRAP